MRGLRRTCLAAALVLLAVPVRAETLVGPIRVIDADTIDIGAPTYVRLVGIDAAETEQTCTAADGRTVACGALATEGVRALYEGRPAVCAVAAYDRYDRALAVCTVEGQEVNARLVELGLARAYRGNATYAAEEDAARAAARGLWAYDMEDPAAWRARQRDREAAATDAPDGCAIKGNISGSGRIYHLPGQQNYDRTRISTRHGERWFCSEEEALAAGWRRARS